MCSSCFYFKKKLFEHYSVWATVIIIDFFQPKTNPCKHTSIVVKHFLRFTLDHWHSNPLTQSKGRHMWTSRKSRPKFPPYAPYVALIKRILHWTLFHVVLTFNLTNHHVIHVLASTLKVNPCTWFFIIWTNKIWQEKKTTCLAFVVLVPSSHLLWCTCKYTVKGQWSQQYVDDLSLVLTSCNITNDIVQIKLYAIIFLGFLFVRIILEVNMNLMPHMVFFILIYPPHLHTFPFIDAQRYSKHSSHLEGPMYLVFQTS